MVLEILLGQIKKCRGEHGDELMCALRAIRMTRVSVAGAVSIVVADELYPFAFDVANELETDLVDLSRRRRDLRF